MRLLRLAPVVLIALIDASSFAAVIIGNWEPKFKGIDFSVSTNTGGGDLPHHQVVSAFRVDLTDPDIKFFTTPRRSPYME